MAATLGMNAKLYYVDGAGATADGTVGTVSTADGTAAGTGAFTEITTAKDVTLTLEKNEADTTTRGNDGWRSTTGTLKEASIEFEVVLDVADTAYLALRDAFLNDSNIGMAALDSAGASGQGLVANFTITNFTRNEPLEEAQTVSVTAKLAEFAVWSESGTP